MGFDVLGIFLIRSLFLFQFCNKSKITRKYRKKRKLLGSTTHQNQTGFQRVIFTTVSLCVPVVFHDCMFKHVSTIQDIYCSHPLSCEVHIRNVLYIGNSSWMSLKMFISSESGRLEKQRTVASGMECSKPPEMSLLAKCGTADLV